MTLKFIMDKQEVILFQNMCQDIVLNSTDDPNNNCYPPEDYEEDDFHRMLHTFASFLREIESQDSVIIEQRK